MKREGRYIVTGFFYYHELCKLQSLQLRVYHRFLIAKFSKMQTSIWLPYNINNKGIDDTKIKNYKKYFRFTIRQWLSLKRSVFLF